MLRRQATVLLRQGIWGVQAIQVRRLRRQQEQLLDEGGVRAHLRLGQRGIEGCRTRLVE